MSHKNFHFVKFFDFYFKFWTRNDRLPNAIYRFVLKLELESDSWDEKSYDKQIRLGMIKPSLEVQGEIGWQSHFSGIRSLHTFGCPVWSKKTIWDISMWKLFSLLCVYIVLPFKPLLSMAYAWLIDQKQCPTLSMKILNSCPCNDWNCNDYGFQFFKIMIDKFRTVEFQISIQNWFSWFDFI